jgi:hypothetical protein
MEFEKVLSGLVKYANNVILPTMNDWQKLGARVLIARVLRSGSDLKVALANNAFIKTFGVISDNGNVDIDGLVADLKKVFEETPTVAVSIPLYGTLKFNATDIDVLKQYIMEA